MTSIQTIITFDIGSSAYFGDVLPLIATATSGATVRFISDSVFDPIYIPRPVGGQPSLIAMCSGIGTAVITASVLSTTNYTAASVTRTITVLPGTMIISFPTIPTKIYGTDAAFNLVSSAIVGSNNQSGEIHYSSSDPTIISVAGLQAVAVATIHAPGSCTLTASVTGNERWGAASVSQEVTVQDPTNGGGGPVPCFTKGTMIRVPSGEVAVETLKRGDLVVTADGRTVAIKGLYTTHVRITTKETAPYLIPAGTYGNRDLLLSPKHAIQIRKGVWNFPGFATQMNRAIRQVAVGEAVEYYHLECPVFLRDNLVANGRVVESFGTLQVNRNPYTYSARLGGFTREGAAAAKHASL